MAEQRNGKQFEELTPDQCIDFAAGLLDREQREDLLLRAAASPESGELLRTVMAQSEAARSTAARLQAEKGSAAQDRAVEKMPASAPAFDLVEGIRRFLGSLFGPGRLVPATAGASLLILGLIVGAGTMHLLGPAGIEAGTPARLISLFPSATRTAGSDTAVSAGSGLYIELNGIDSSSETPLFFDLADPSGQTLLEGRLHCQPETGEWAGLFLPAALLAEEGEYRLQVRPDSGAGSPAVGPLEYRFSIRLGLTQE